MKDTASTRQVLVIRPAAPGTNPSVLELNYDKALLGDTGALASLQPSDIVFVPRSRIAKVNRWVDQYLRKNVPIPLALGWYRAF
jgi:polysaccharide biosynthesis/export protein